MSKTHYVCRECGAVAIRWQGQCPGCNAWNTLEEQRADPAAGRFDPQAAPFTNRGIAYDRKGHIVRDQRDYARAIADYSAAIRLDPKRAVAFAGRGAAYQAPCFVLVGNESRGLPADYEAVCDLRVTIPMRGRADSLNAAVAAAVLAYEVDAVLRR